MAPKISPILVAAFPDQGKLWKSVDRLRELGISSEFIGVFIGANGARPGHPHELHLVSAFAPSRLHEEIRAVFIGCGAADVGYPPEMRESYGSVPHPGAIEDHDLKLPLGMEYPDTVRRRTPANASGARP